MKKNNLKVTLIRSGAGRKPAHRATLEGLGLRRQRQEVMLQDTPAIRGMIHKVSYLVKVEET